MERGGREKLEDMIICILGDDEYTGWELGVRVGISSFPYVRPQIKLNRSCVI